ncbi:hypothetical protein B0H14DRAFT_3423802 [Mycena olivaceomarginata]|nr:hypothetical protein B0H14DRAFT_3529725 [Mycena olivaceomarginata]KAJ7899494.1 hypothetical protein B0H14DRAFT_3423802 [Mycena olivaceomarginata]
MPPSEPGQNLNQLLLFHLGDGQRALADAQDNILCVADSQAMLEGILQTSPRSGQHRMIHYHTVIRQALSLYPHLAILNLWTLAHIGMIGNELADATAKKATSLTPDPSTFI